MSHERAPWRAILGESEAAHANVAIERIAEDLDRYRAELAQLPAGTPATAQDASDAADIALFFHYQARCATSTRDASTALDRGAKAQQCTYELFAQAEMPPGFIGGFSGIAWVLNHIAPASQGSEDPCSEIDDAILELVLAGAHGAHDLVMGLVGFAVYARGRGSTALRSAITTQLLQCSETTHDALTWRTAAHLLPPWQRDVAPKGYYNLGVAHGLPAILLTLARDVEHPGAMEQYEGGLRFLEQSWPIGAQLPDWRLPEEAAKAKHPRLAWCQNDLGGALVALHAAQEVEDADAQKRMLRRLELTLKRPKSQSFVQDAPLCHGAAGVAHCYNRAYQATRDKRFERAAVHWYSCLSELEHPTQRPGGFPMRMPTSSNQDTPAWSCRASLLEGAAGVGLALLAATCPVEPLWDERLLIDIAPGSVEAL